MQGRLTPVVPRIRISARLHQHPDDGGISLPGRPVKGGPAPVSRSIGVGARLQQPHHHGEILVVDRVVERSVAIGVSRVDVPAGVDAPGHVVVVRRLGEPLRARVLAVRGIRRPALVVAGHGIRTQLQQGAHNLGVGVGPRCMQGRVSAGVPGVQIRACGQQGGKG